MIECASCTVKFRSVQQYNKHQFSHRLMKNHVFKCVYNKCEAKFDKFRAFKSHVSRRHDENHQNHNATQKVICCKVENCNFSSIFSNMIKHCREHINLEKKVVCPYDNCNQVLSNASTFSSHVFRIHKKVEDSKKELGVSSNEYENITAENWNEEEEIISEDSNDCENSMGNLFLKMKTLFNIQENAINFMVNEMKNINSLKCEKIVKILNEFCNTTSKNNSVDLIAKIKPFIEFEELKNFDTSYKRNKYYKDKFNYVNPMEINLGRNDHHKECSYFYIPIKKTLSLLFLSKKFQEQFVGHRTNTSILSDYYDGEVYKRNPFFQVDKRIELFLYQDAFEICNPLSSSKGKHKLIAFYYTLGNMFPHYRTQTDNIFLALLCKEIDVKYFGFKLVLEPFIRDLKDIEINGLKVDLFGIETIIKGTVVATLGDNLGCHQIGGFSENFSTSKYICRYCYCTKHDLHSGNLEPKQLRNVVNYSEDYNQFIENSEQLLANNYNGVKMNSCLNELNYFHVCNPGLAPCIAHDIFEGILKYDFWMILKYFVSKNIFTFDFLNTMFCKVTKKLKVNICLPKLSKNMSKIPGTAYENWNFVIYFPLIVLGKNIDPEDYVWKMFLCLLEIVRLICADKISEQQIILLKNVINEYFEYCKISFPHYSMRPKHHYLQHYPSLIRQFGPLIRLWTMHFEHKHQTLKRIYVKYKNSKNILKLISENHELLQASLFNDRFQNDLICNDVVSLSHDVSKDSIYSKFKFIAKSVKIFGKIYKMDDIIIYDIDENFFIKVLKIKHICIDKDYKSPHFYGESGKMVFNYLKGLHELVEHFDIHELVSYHKLKSKNTYKLYSHRNTSYLSIAAAI